MAKNEEVPMSQATFERLQRQRDEFERQLATTGQEMGEAGGTSDWHDNPIFDEARIRFDRIRTDIIALSLQISNARIIQPNQNTEMVGIGHKVAVLIEDQEETYTILGQPDASPSEGIISFLSPLAQAMIGQVVNSTFEVITPGGKVEGRIVKISPADL